MPIDPKRLANLSAAKRKLLEEILGREESGGLVPKAGADATEQSESWVLTPPQRRIWFLEKLHPGQAFNGSVTLEVDGRMDIEALKEALATVVARHPILRMRVVDGDPPHAVPAKAATFDFDVIDLAGQPASKLVAAGHALANRRFDPKDSRSLLAALLVLVAPQRSVLIISVHMIAFDAPSARALVSELDALYRARSSAAAAALPPVRAYAQTWHVMQPRPERIRAELDYWRETLAGDLPVLDFASAHPRREGQSFAGRRLPLRVDRADAEALARLARAQKTTIFVIALSALYAVLHRWSAQTDLVVGTWVARRSAVNRSIVGPFVNTLALRTDLSGDPTWEELLSRTRTTVFGALAHQSVPFEQVVAAIAPLRQPSLSPVFQVNFVLQDTGADDGAAIRLSRHDTEIGGTIGYDLEFVIRRDESGITGYLEHNVDMFDDTLGSALARDFEATLRAIPDRIAERLSADAARAAGETPGEPPQGDAFGEWLAALEDMFAAEPQAGALEDTYGPCSRAELADAVAARISLLRGHGVGPRDKVLLSPQPGRDHVASLLAIWHVGACAAPVPPLGDARLADLAREIGALHILSPTSGVPEIRVLGGDRPSRGDGLAYVLRTSGTTGAATNVAVTRDALAAYLRAAAGMLDLGPGDRVLQFHDPAFDVSLEEILPALARGAVIVAADRHARRAPDGFSNFLETRGITVANIPASFWHLWAEALLAAGERPPRMLRLLVIGSEAVDAVLLERWQARWKGVPAMLCAYGQTETTITAAVYPVPASFIGSGPDAAPIGSPLPGLRHAVLGPSGQALGRGMIGELALAGPQLSRGHVSHGVLIPWAASRRVRHGFLATGDLVRERADGVLEWHGRKDSQIKVRGYRIDIDQVRRMIASSPLLRGSKVMVEGTGASRAVVVEVQGCTAAAARHALRDMLVCAEAVHVRVPTSEPPTAAGREHLDRLLSLAQATLGRPARPEDEFFALGGDSFSALQFADALSKAGLRVSLADIYSSKTFDELARRGEDER